MSAELGFFTVYRSHFNVLFCDFSLQLCVQNSPQEARNMLLQNPQLAYALLQAQVVMRIVDPEIALVSGDYNEKEEISQILHHLSV